LSGRRLPTARDPVDPLEQFLGKNRDNLCPKTILKTNSKNYLLGI
jgi:hypothetical protein